MVILVIEYCKEFRFSSVACCACMGGCVGGCAKPPPANSVERSSRRHSSRGGSGLFLLKKDGWFSSPERMESSVNNRHSVKDPSVGSTSQTEETQTTNRNADNSTFVNHALNLWNENRRQWIGNRPKKRPVHREPVISWTTTYDDLLATNETFSQPIPLPEMIDFLVDVWQEEGLYE